MLEYPTIKLCENTKQRLKELLPFMDDYEWKWKYLSEKEIKHLKSFDFIIGELLTFYNTNRGKITALKSGYFINSYDGCVKFTLKTEQIKNSKISTVKVHYIIKSILKEMCEALYEKEKLKYNTIDGKRFYYYEKEKRVKEFQSYNEIVNELINCYLEYFNVQNQELFEMDLSKKSEFLSLNMCLETKFEHNRRLELKQLRKTKQNKQDLEKFKKSIEKAKLEAFLDQSEDSINILFSDTF